MVNMGSDDPSPISTAPNYSIGLMDNHEITIHEASPGNFPPTDGHSTSYVHEEGGKRVTEAISIQ